MLTPEFTVRRMRRLAPRIVGIVDQHLDALERHGPPADLVARYALPIPSLVICELLGVPPADQEEFQARTGRQLDVSLPDDERAALPALLRRFPDLRLACADDEVPFAVHKAIYGLEALPVAW